MDLTTAKSLFGTHKLGEQGVEMPINHPATGQPTGQFLTILSADCAAFRRTRLKHSRLIATTDWTKEKPEAKDAAVEEGRISMIAALISGWTLETPFSPAGAEDLVRECPAIADQIDTFSSNRANFIESGSQNSESSPAANSASA